MGLHGVNQQFQAGSRPRQSGRLANHRCRRSFTAAGHRCRISLRASSRSTSGEAGDGQFYGSGVFFCYVAYRSHWILHQNSHVIPHRTSPDILGEMTPCPRQQRSNLGAQKYCRKYYDVLGVQESIESTAAGTVLLQERRTEPRNACYRFPSHSVTSYRSSMPSG